MVRRRGGSGKRREDVYQRIKRQWCTVLENTLRHHRARYPQDERSDWELMTAAMESLVAKGVVSRDEDGRFIVGCIVVRHVGGRP
jgi:hypothetical protein